MRRRALAVVPPLALALAAAALLALGAALRSRPDEATAHQRRAAFAASVQRGARTPSAAQVAGALRAELDAQRAAAERRDALAWAAFAAAALAALGLGAHLALGAAGRTGEDRPHTSAA